MVKAIWWVTGILIAIGLGAIYYFRPQAGSPANTQTQPPVELPVPETPAEPVVRHPPPQSQMADTEEQPPLPALEESDKPIQEALSESAAPASIEQFLVPDNIVRRFVTTI